MKDSSFLSQALSSGVSPNALLAEQPELGAGHTPTCARIGLAQPPSQSGVDTLELSKLVGEDLSVGEVLSSPEVLLGGLFRERKGRGVGVRSMKERNSASPHPHVRGLAGAAALCPRLLPLPCSGPLVQSHLPQLAVLPHGPALWAALASTREARGWGCVCPREQVRSLLAVAGLLAPLQALHLLRDGFAHVLRLPQAERLPPGQRRCRPPDPGGA